MDYIMSNKEAWEEAFDNRSKDWGKDIKYRLENEELPFIEKVLADELIKYDFKNKTIAQFCCNNGRELFSFMKLGASYGVGFDIAENMVSFANSTAKELGINCSFVSTNICKIDEKYHDTFDYIFITIGALTWFEDLSEFFKKVSLCLKKDGRLIINEMHPVTNMLAFNGEEEYDEKNPSKIEYSYFRKEPWVEDNGMGYMTNKAYDSKTFYSYSHTVSLILNSIIKNNMHVEKMIEFDYDISGMFSDLDNKGIPLSYILISQKY
ncbi:class I SAM-dependent methyltransferase [Herbivorax sp. ANBcel31]|uniref:class I SAM-dependent methyltransferase n=1 Tax=Herbivorax sp. ANBcel31 TaxID=3069754 RepID=UPI0027AE8AB3|nr:class I SAM-dependent methyltransferase [Herbivorax sp. ANBcel31]MDQ2088028.1 class I SAM-dependent methyltransferase [Herbivorax sp. ANBcel31]